MTLGPRVHEQMFRSGGQSDARPPVLSSQASLVLIYQPTEGMKGCVDLTQSGVCTLDMWCGSAVHEYSIAWLLTNE
ncbi:hypothetical protein TNCV_4943821 [Trichonephila clavipes]|nr:hypothetical protein TNCV_4943821 [Trichonephila clavipes]